VNQKPQKMLAILANIIIVIAWAPPPGGQAGHVPTLEIIWEGIAHPEFTSLERVWVHDDCPPWILCKNSRLLYDDK